MNPRLLHQHKPIVHILTFIEWSIHNHDLAGIFTDVVEKMAGQPARLVQQNREDRAWIEHATLGYLLRSNCNPTLYR